MKYTKPQINAITATNPFNLISAAAGSGKTAILIERIIHQIVNFDKSIDRMLIVTFTRAAAAEMRERLEHRFYHSKEHIELFRQQSNKLPNAQISTLHAYCSKLIKRNFVPLEIDPLFRLLDERSRERIYCKVKEEQLDALYESSKEDKDVKIFIKQYYEKEISEMLDTLYSYIISRPEPLKWLEEQKNKEYDIKTFHTLPVGIYIINQIKMTIAIAKEQLENIYILAEKTDFPEKYNKTIKSDAETLEELENIENKSFEDILSLLKNIKFARIAIVKATTTAELQICETYKNKRNELKDTITKMSKRYSQELKSEIVDMQAMATATKILCNFVASFHEAFLIAKKEENVLDYNDLEHFASLLLNIPEIQKRESEAFDCIFVDEYQDTSALQDDLLKKLVNKSGNQSFFYVGDVKQSIYGFRQAEPKLFLEKLQNYSEDENSEKRKIMLNLNFRSNPTIIESVNRVFEKLLREDITEINYDAGQRLYTGIKDKLPSNPTQVHILNKTRDSVKNEALLVAMDIKRRMKENPNLTYRDIAILMPVVTGVAQKVTDILMKENIPTFCDARDDIFRSDEIIALADFLKVMSNSHYDLGLISVLRSSLYQLTDQMLADIRLAKPEKEASFYMALEYVAARETNDELTNICKEVVASLERERFAIDANPLPNYLWDFLLRSGIYFHFGTQKGGKQRQANLRMVCHMASDYYTSGKIDLDGFISLLDDQIKVKNSTAPVIINPWENIVRIMSIHKSKGLEFDTVYIIGLGGMLISRREYLQLINVGDLGIGIQYRNEKMRTKRKTLLQTTIMLNKMMKLRAERARLLYVAMTRAKEQLILIGTSGETEKWLTEVQDLEEKNELSLYAISTENSMIGWIRQLINQEDSINVNYSTDLSTYPQWISGAKPLPTHNPQNCGQYNVVFHMLTTENEKIEENTENNEIKQEIPHINRPQFEGLIHIPPDTSTLVDPLVSYIKRNHQILKVGATTLSKFAKENSYPIIETYFPQVDAEIVPLPEVKPMLLPDEPEVPEFIAPMKKNPGLLTGTHTHRLLSTILLDELRNNNEDMWITLLEKRKEFMYKNNIIPKDEIEYCLVEPVFKFFKSDLGKRMLASKEVLREMPFTMKLNNKDQTVLQGILDVCFKENDEYVLIDFKTDAKLNLKQLGESYKNQILLYQQAILTITGKPPIYSYLYSLSHDNYYTYQ